MLHARVSRLGFSLLLLVSGYFSSNLAQGQEIGFVEDFAIGNREVALKKLIPGTETYYFYHCLHLQNQQKFADVEPILKEWIKRHNYTALVHRILNRQALLTYDDNPERTLARIRDRLNLKFNHQRDTLNRKPNLPTSLNQDAISRVTLQQRALASYRNLDGFENSSFSWLISSELNAARRRHLLSRLTRPDHNGLAKMVIADLRYRGSGGFGSLKIHRQLLKDQLDECLRLMPELLNQTNFVNAYITKLRPSDDKDIRYDREALAAYLDRLLGFLRRLGPVHNSLKAQALYHLLVLERAQGKYDKTKFLEYIALPRRLNYFNPELLRNTPQRHLVNLAANYQGVTLLKPVSNDEPLVRSFLAHFLEDENSYQVYTRFIRDTYLKQVFAETKILNGLGDEQTWYALLSPTQLKNLRDRVDLDFAFTNKSQFKSDDPVSLDIFIKNVKSLIVKVYEVNTLNYYRENKSEISTNLNLDGLVANHVRKQDLKDAPLRRVKRRFEFPEIKASGTYVIDFIGNGKSSRVLVRKGTLRYLARTSSAGHILRVLDEDNNHLKKSSVWIAGREYVANDKGDVVVPFTAKPGSSPLILSADGFSVLDRLQWLSESYQLRAGFFVDRESIVSGTKASVIIRPVLTVNGIPVSLSILKDVQLSLRSVNLDGISSTKQVKDFKLAENAESSYEFQVPNRLQQLTFTLTAKVKNLSQNKDITTSAAHTISVNGIHRGQYTEDLYLARSNKGFHLEVLGKSGEAKPDRAIMVTLKHRDFRQPVAVALKSDPNGHVHLGELKDIVSVQARGPEGAQHAWQLPGSSFTYPASIHVAAGRRVELPFNYNFTPVNVSLFGLRGSTYTTNHFGQLNVKDGMLTIDKLAAGDYELIIRDGSHRVRVRVSDGETRHGYVFGSARQLEIRNQNWLQISRIEQGKKETRIFLKNANKQARVHLVANRYETRFPVFNQFAQISDVSPLAIRPSASLTQYVAGRKLGDEFQYIIDRALAERYPGNMLNRPTLLLNPWAVRKTETGRQTAKAGADFAAKPNAAPRAAARAPGQRGGRGGTTGFTSFDFLGSPGAIVLNLEPDKNGVVTIKNDAIAGYHQIHVVAADTLSTAHRHLIQDASPLVHQDLRLATSLPPDVPHTEQKKISIIRSGADFAIKDVGSSSFEIYDDLEGVFRLFTTLNKDPKLEEFRFILRWPEMSRKEKLDNYSKYACHELHFFLFKKDRKFFDEVVKPYLAFKKDKTFLDRFLLDRKLNEYLAPWQHGQLNTLERILLSHRVDGERPNTRRLIDEQVGLLPPGDAVWERLFETAVTTSSLDASGVFTGRAAGKPMAVGGRLGRGGRGRVSGGGLGGAMGGGGGGFGGGAAAPASPASKAMNSPADAPARVLKLADKQKEALNETKRFSRRRSFAQDRFAKDELARKGTRSLYQKLDKTQEWAENNYYKLPIEQQTANLVKANAFWQEYAAADGPQFLSSEFTRCTSNFSEMMLALALLDLPFKAKKHDLKFEEGGMKLKSASSLIVVHREISATRKSDENTPILVSQNFFRHGDRYRQVNNVRLDKFVKDEFLAKVVYGCQVVITNPTSAPQRLSILVQIPEGAMPVLNGKQTKSINVMLQPYNTTSQEFYFYFPTPGDYAHSPVHVAQKEKVIASAEPFKFKVVAEPSSIDNRSWQYISQHGTNEQVLDYLQKNNLQKLQLAKIAFRMKDKAFFKKTTDFLRAHHAYNSTLWSYGLLHNDVKTIAEYLPHANNFVAQCGPFLRSTLLTIDPVERKSYQHLEYKPLVNARAHSLGKRRQIVNSRFHGQYHGLLNILAHKRDLDDDDRMSLIYYLLLQDRIGESLAQFKDVDSGRLETEIQYDFMAAYLDFFSDRPDVARKVVDKYKEYPVVRWKQSFDLIRNQLAEIDGKKAGVVDPMDRDQRQAQLAASESNVELTIVGKEIRVDYQNIESVRINFYEMDIELLFSRNPFVQQQSNQFSYIRPNGTQVHKLKKDAKQLKVTVPDKFANKNVLIEVQGGGKRRSSTYFSNSLTVEFIENYGQLKVARTSNRRALSKVYVKVYARMKNGQVRFFKDGYTDLRGRFDYTSLNTDEISQVDKLAVLVLSEKFGAVVREVKPPRQ